MKNYPHHYYVEGIATRQSFPPKVYSFINNKFCLFYSDIRDPSQILQIDHKGVIWIFLQSLCECLLTFLIFGHNLSDIALERAVLLQLQRRYIRIYNIILLLQMEPQQASSMITDPMITEINEILTKLNMKSIDELLQLDNINLQVLSHRTHIHREVIAAYLMRLHRLIMHTQLLGQRRCSSRKQPLIKLTNIYPQLAYNIDEAEIIQVVGRANAGKSTIMAQMMKQALQSNVKPILLGSGFSKRVYESIVGAQNYMYFPFETMQDLGILIHCIGNRILDEQIRNQHNSNEYIVFIDCLSRIQLQNESIQFDGSEKFRRLLNSLVTKTQATIIYSYRISQGLFQNQYKKQWHRPKCKNSKQWDGWTNKSIVVDYVVRRKDLKQLLRINLPKNLDHKLYEIVL